MKKIFFALSVIFLIIRGRVFSAEMSSLNISPDAESSALVNSDFMRYKRSAFLAETAPHILGYNYQSICGISYTSLFLDMTKVSAGLIFSVKNWGSFGTSLAYFNSGKIDPESQNSFADDVSLSIAYGNKVFSSFAVGGGIKGAISRKFGVIHKGVAIDFSAGEKLGSFLFGLLFRNIPVLLESKDFFSSLICVGASFERTFKIFNLSFMTAVKLREYNLWDVSFGLKALLKESFSFNIGYLIGCSQSSDIFSMGVGFIFDRFSADFAFNFNEFMNGYSGTTIYSTIQFQL